LAELCFDFSNSVLSSLVIGMQLLLFLPCSPVLSSFPSPLYRWTSFLTRDMLLCPPSSQWRKCNLQSRLWRNVLTSLPIDSIELVSFCLELHTFQVKILAHYFPLPSSPPSLPNVQVRSRTGVRMLGFMKELH